jgi:hypothetical protein
VDGVNGGLRARATCIHRCASVSEGTCIAQFNASSHCKHVHPKLNSRRPSLVPGTPPDSPNISPTAWSGDAVAIAD